jgi:uncharacterized protein YjiS (DUF1127 family)
MIMSMSRTSCLTAAIRQLCAAYITWRMEQSAVAVLQSMSDRLLSDLGLSRSDITRSVQRSPADRAAPREH